jgi:flagellar biosynthesis/type III secretory pathway protein FliH
MIMKTNKIVGVILGLAVLCGIGLGGNAYGQLRRNRNWDGYPNWGGSYDLRQTALNAGYNEGSKEGRSDHDRGRHSDYSSFSAFQKATKDYSSRLGDRELYRRYFQLAFSRGYETENPGQIRTDRNDRNDRSNQDNDRDRNRDNNRQSRGRNWDRYGSYGGSYQLRQTALNAGYNEGIKQGRNDRRRGRHANYNDFSSYRNATQDYSSKLGDRELYRRYYREGFENGYEDGYNGG